MNKAIGVQLLPLLNQMYKQGLLNKDERNELSNLTKKAVSTEQPFYRVLLLKLNALKHEKRTPQERTLLDKTTSLLQEYHN